MGTQHERAYAARQPSSKSRVYARRDVTESYGRASDHSLCTVVREFFGVGIEEASVTDEASTIVEQL